MGVAITNTNALNKMTSPPPLPSPLEGEGWVGVQRFIASVLAYLGSQGGNFDSEIKAPVMVNPPTILSRGFEIGSLLFCQL